MKKENEYAKALSEGDRGAFAWLFLHYQPKLIVFFAGFVHDDEVARDMAQDIFFSLWTNRTKLSAVRSFSSYLYQVARNVLFNYYDHSLVCEKYDAEQLFRPLVADDTEELLFARELQGLIDLKVEQMPPQRRLIFRMSRVEGLNNDEIAANLNISKRTVENHLTAALSDLRQILKIVLLFY